jgi:hypothetical protein
MDLTTIAEIWWDFDDQDPNWLWCVGHAGFAHREACEFVLYIGSQFADDAFWKLEIDRMRYGGCTEDFIAAYLAAKDAGAVRVLFYC